MKRVCETRLCMNMQIQKHWIHFKLIKLTSESGTTSEGGLLKGFSLLHSSFSLCCLMCCVSCLSLSSRNSLLSCAFTVCSKRNDDFTMLRLYIHVHEQIIDFPYLAKIINHFGFGFFDTQTLRDYFFVVCILWRQKDISRLRLSFNGVWI